jgi:hypothetical protein
MLGQEIIPHVCHFSAILPIFGKNIAVFLKNLCYDQIFAKTRSSLDKKRQILVQIF